MDISEMKAYLALYEKKSIRQAAAEIFISPQGLSRILQKLEAEYNVPLFRRSVQGLVPTEMGEYLYQETKKSYAFEQNIRRNLLAMSEQNKDIRIVCSYGVMEALNYYNIADYQERHPEISLSWREYPDKQALAALLNNEYPVGIIVKGENDVYEDFNETILRSRSVVVLVYEGHPLYGKETIELKELEHEPLIIEGDDFWINHAFREASLAAGIVPDIVIETGDISFLHKLCSMKQGLGISIDFVADYIQIDNVRAIPIVKSGLFWSVSMLSAKALILSEKEKEFCEYIKSL